jgi:hypothetical protein
VWWCLSALCFSLCVFYLAMDLSTAGLVIGGATVVGGVAGLFLGAWSSDYWKHKGVKNAYYLVRTGGLNLIRAGTRTRRGIAEGGVEHGS